MILVAYVFLGFGIFLGVVAFFTSIVADDLTGVFFSVPSSAVRVGCVNPSGFGRL